MLLPQLAVAAYVRRLPCAKACGCLAHCSAAVALAFMALSIATLDGVAAGWVVLALVTLFSLARGLCSVSAKDVLGKIGLQDTARVLMGYSAAAAGVVTC